MFFSVGLSDVVYLIEMSVTGLIKCWNRVVGKKEVCKTVLDLLYIILFVAIIIVIPIVIRRRKKAGVTGIKSALTSICFFLIAAINLLAYWLDFMGLLSWAITVVLLIAAAYFTKYFPVPYNSG